MRKLPKSDTQELAHTLIADILRNYPIINSLNTTEDKYRAIIRLDLGGFKRGKASVYSYPFKGVKNE